MTTHIELAKELIAHKDFKKLDDLWTEMIIDKKNTLDDYFEIADELKKNDESERAFFLLEVLATHLESETEYKHALLVLRKMLHYNRDSNEIRKKIIGIYKNSYKESPHIDNYIEISGLDKTAPIFKSIEKLEELLRYDVGRCFYFERYGFGEVVDVRPSKKEIIINFEKKERHFLTFDIAKGLLMPVDKDHFLYKKSKAIYALEEMAASNPIELISFMLKSFQEPLTTSQIKKYLEGIIEKNILGKWWEKVRKKLETDEKIKISGKAAKTYTYVESGIDREKEAISAFDSAKSQEKYLLAQDYAKNMPAVFDKILSGLVELGNHMCKKDSALALDIVMLCNDLKLETNFSYTVDDVLDTTKPEKLIKNLNSLEHQKTLLKVIKKDNPDTWTDIFEKILFSTDNFKLLDEITQMFHDLPNRLDNIYYAIFSMPKHHPQQFQWFLKKVQSGELTEYLKPTYVPRLIESLDYAKGIKAVVNKILSLENFDAMLKKANEYDAQRIIETVNRSGTLADHEKRDFLRIIEYYFPQFLAQESDIIYTTEQALKCKKEELNHIYNIEIPKNKKEISRAREFGDLSDNFEYKAAKERQDQLYQKLKMLGAELKKAVIIDPQKIDNSRVDIGTKVALKSLQDDKLINYTILGRWDTDLKKNIISNEAPVAQTLLGKKCGEHVTLNNITYEIVKIEKGI